MVTGLQPCVWSGPCRETYMNLIKGRLKAFQNARLACKFIVGLESKSYIILYACWDPFRGSSSQVALYFSSLSEAESYTLHVSYWPKLKASCQNILTVDCTTSSMSLPRFYPKTQWSGGSQFECHYLLSSFPPIYHGFWRTQQFKPHAHSDASFCHRCNYCNIDFVGFDAPNNSNHTLTMMHHFVIVVIIATLTLCYSVMSHAKLILFYHTLMLTLQKSLISRALWLSHMFDVMKFKVYYYVLESPITKKNVQIQG